MYSWGAELLSVKNVITNPLRALHKGNSSRESSDIQFDITVDGAIYVQQIGMKSLHISLDSESNDKYEAIVSAITLKCYYQLYRLQIIKNRILVCNNQTHRINNVKRKQVNKPTVKPFGRILTPITTLFC